MSSTCTIIAIPCQWNDGIWKRVYGPVKHQCLLVEVVEPIPWFRLQTFVAFGDRAGTLLVQKVQ